MSPDPTGPAELVGRARAGDARAVARLVSLVENAPVGGGAGLGPILGALAAEAAREGSAHVVGLTGAPGVGKSTITSALVAELRARGRRVAVLAVDPSSPFSGGALLGDRIRMTEHAGDPGVFIRSMASRGHLGGLAWATPQVLRVLASVGFDVVVVETVGVGQSEVEIAALADSTVVVLAPGMGDGIQAAKAGILEVGDLYVVNKADRDGADQVRRDLRGMLRLADRPAGSWQPAVLTAVAPSGTGIGELAEALERHRGWLTETGELARRLRRRAREEVEALATGMLRARWDERETGLGELADAVLAGELDPYAAARSLVEPGTDRDESAD
ncbi:MAG: methylmalonyl Co-A mutase-associated GTPase MeaB [Nocardioides sp.]|uniref:methylmalonyl Co-A mutase-associated GTPase MeaB n=1 Tax=Nocardioides sp. TaxID=35761 RepID=UPI0039E2BA19